MADDARPNLKLPETVDLPPQERLLTVDEFLRMANAGFYSEEGKHELWDGRVMMTPPAGPHHMDRERRIVQALTLALHAAGLLDHFGVQTGGGVKINEYNLRGPDVMIVRLPFNKDADLTGDGVALVIEIAMSSLVHDLTEKRGKYAAAGIPEYWVIDIAHGLIHPFRNPKAGDYPDCGPLGEGATISPLFAAAITLNVADLI
ncbi:MAG: Uma2 family endonuclease [Hyphomonadaceae bacterium]|nr:Uma2 family endonuclease [Hyphomonadaceae bacterium]